jgi:CDP-diacylglycerol--glycerol-3-phosphate 3-phosphatidyltransferase
MLKGTRIEVTYYKLLRFIFIPALTYLGAKPDHLSMLGLIVSLLAGIAFAFMPALGGVLTLLTGLVDTLDGCLARSLNQERKYGAFLDSVLDRYTELIIYLGIWFYFYREDAATPFLSLTILLILFGSLMVSYTRARAEGLGQNCLVGLLQRGERIILIGLAGIFNTLCNGLTELLSLHGSKDLILFLALTILAVGTNLTAVWRFLHVLRNLRS